MYVVVRERMHVAHVCSTLGTLALSATSGRVRYLLVAFLTASEIASRPGSSQCLFLPNFMVMPRVDRSVFPG